MVSLTPDPLLFLHHFLGLYFGFVLLVTGRYPRNLFTFNVSALQWVARVNSWQFLMRDDRSLFGTTQPVQWAVGLGVVLLVLSLWSPVSLPGVQNFGSTLVDRVGTFVPAKREGEIILRQFMEAGQRNDVQGATALLYEDDTIRSQLEELFSLRHLFQDYEAIRTSGWHWEKGTAGETVELEGQISYARGEDGVFYALLIKDEGDWKIENLLLDRP